MEKRTLILIALCIAGLSYCVKFASSVNGDGVTPLKAPRNVTVTNKTSTALLINWTHVNNSELLGYRVRFNRNITCDSAGNYTNCSVSIFLCKNYTSIWLEDLEIYTDYWIEVVAFKNGTFSENNSTSVARTDEGACVNIYNDAYCHLHIRNCWVQSYAPKLIKNCRKTCLCGCCSAIPATTSSSATITTVTTTTTTATTTDTSTKLRTLPQTTTYRTGHWRTTDVTAMTSLGTHSPSHSGAAKNTSPSTRVNTNEDSTKDSLERIGSSKLDTVLLSVIIASAVVVIGILALLLLCFWRKKNSGSLDQQKKSPLPTVLPDTESIPNSPLYQVLEGPNDLTTNDTQELSAHTERSPRRFRSDSDYDEPTDRAARPVVGLAANAKKNDTQYEVIDKNRNPRRIINGQQALENGVEYSCSYSVANENLSIEVSNKNQQEVPNRQDPRYHVLERPNNLYQGLERETRDNSHEQMRDLNPSDYQALDETTQSFYHPLKKNDKSSR